MTFEVLSSHPQIIRIIDACSQHFGKIFVGLNFLNLGESMQTINDFYSDQFKNLNLSIQSSHGHQYTMFCTGKRAEEDRGLTFNYLIEHDDKNNTITLYERIEPDQITTVSAHDNAYSFETPCRTVQLTKDFVKYDLTNSDKMAYVRCFECLNLGIMIPTAVY
jgi:hypothetical protein